MIILKGTLEIPITEHTKALPALEAHIEETKKEPGNLAIEITPYERSIELFKVYEVFEDEESYQAHQELTKSREWGKISENFRREYHREEK